MEKYVVLMSPSVNIAEFGPSTMGARSIPTGELRVETAELSKKDIRDLQRDSDLVSFAPVMPLKLHEPVARDVKVSANEKESWGISAVGAQGSAFTGKGVKVAVLDTGIDAGHEAFKGVNIVQQDFTGEGDGDSNGHGTHCAGTIFGQSVNGVRIGIAPGVEQALVGKVLGSKGGGSTDSISKAIMWALNNGANVISMSLGMDFPGLVDSLVKSGFPADLATSKALEAYRANTNLFGSLADFARNRGAFFQGSVIVAASGNESKRMIHPDYEIAVAPPAASAGIYAVGAVEQTKDGLKVAVFSNTKVDVCAPGVGIVSARAGGGLVGMSGTSMATPHVAGIAALWAERLLTAMGSVDTTALSAKLVASGTHAPLARPYDPLDVGTGIVQAPTSL